MPSSGRAANSSGTESAAPLAGSFRRLAAATYDGLLLLAVLMAITALGLAFTHGPAIVTARVGSAVEYLYRGVLVLCVGAFYASAWTRRGQTLGMKAWHLRLESNDGALPKLGSAVRRLAIAGPLYLLAIVGLMLLIARRGNAAIVIGCELPLVLSYAWHSLFGRGTLHDRFSGTRVVKVPAESPG